ncbi:hypothetical protein H9Q08_17285 [Chryseobacterium sp. PS-8]|uniref:TMhelix containing protein n=1 Tax=Chryseobacterium indicum TaxID=2766954 RepID=A0ABS9C8Y1_9FLAO|nr:hypothetical protein [Chryseobacterium sp. PS-8]MCF2221042.1 hypothetical protein [Chryseobacterium sp. PS-8]
MKKLFVGAAIVVAGLASAKGTVVSNSKVTTEINANAALVNTLMQNEKIVKLNNNTLSQEQLRTVVEYTVTQVKSNQMAVQVDCAAVGKIVKAVVSMLFPNTDQQTLDLVVAIVTVICEVMQP